MTLHQQSRGYASNAEDQQRQNPAPEDSNRSQSIPEQSSNDTFLALLKSLNNGELKAVWDKYRLPELFSLNPTPSSLIQHLESKNAPKNVILLLFRNAALAPLFQKALITLIEKTAGGEKVTEILNEINQYLHKPTTLHHQLLNLVKLDHSQITNLFVVLYDADSAASAKIAEPKSLQDHATNAIFTPATTPLSSPTETPEYVLTSVDPNLTSPVFVSLILHV